MIEMDKVEGCNEEKWMGSKFEARMWICIKAVMCDGRGRPPLQIIMECASWLREDSLWEHERMTEPNVLWKENDILEALNCGLDVLCQPSGDTCGSLHRQGSTKNCNNVTKISNYRETVNMTIEITFKCPLTECTRHDRAYYVQSF